MEKEMIDKLVEMLKSGDEEMRMLAVTLFSSNTNQYRDYFELRTVFDDKAIILDEPYQGLFNKMFNNLDKSSVMDQWEEMRNKYRENERIGRHEIIKRSCIVTSKQEQTKQIKNKQNGK